MKSRDLIDSMWLQACDALDRAERIHRQFFKVERVGRGPAWQPPVDLFESDGGLLVRAAIPGADENAFEVHLEHNRLHLFGRRAFPTGPQSFVIHRLEIPYGCIERVIALPEGRFELEAYSYTRGCLDIHLRRIMDGSTKLRMYRL
jgi:HSP20 family molecular chaperone IbpA